MFIKINKEEEEEEGRAGGEEHMTKTVCFLQLDNKQEDRDQVVILFQDMLEVTTRDIMDDHMPRCRFSPILFSYCCSLLGWSTYVYVNIMLLFLHFSYLECSLLDSIHGGSGHEGMIPLEQQYQLFASLGAIKFPCPSSEAWKEKVCQSSQE